MQEGFVLVIGSAGIDIKGRPACELKWEMSNPGMVRNSVGGVARNIAENLARLEVPAMLLSAVGDDSEGRRVVNKTTAAGVDCSQVRQVPGGQTGSYVALLKPDGELHVAISDFSIIDCVDSDYLLEHEDLFDDAQLIVIDATLTEETLETAFELAGRYRTPICADPTNPTLASRICPYLSQLYLIVPNAAETEALCGDTYSAADSDAAIAAARHLVSLGTKIAVVTMGEHGIAYAHSNGGGFIRSLRADVMDATGAGDAFTAAVIFGLMNEVPVDEAMRLGVTAASLTLRSKDTVLPNINQELLYEELVV